MSIIKRSVSFLNHSSLSYSISATLSKCNIYAKCPEICCVTSVLSIECIVDFNSYFNPTGSTPFLHLFNNISKTESFPVNIFVIDNGKGLLFKTSWNYLQSLTPPNKTIFCKFLPLFNSIVVSTNYFIN